MDGYLTGRFEKVVPYIGTWIETDRDKSMQLAELVVPYIGTWIETNDYYPAK